MARNKSFTLKIRIASHLRRNKRVPVWLIAKSGLKRSLRFKRKSNWRYDKKNLSRGVE